MQITFRDYTPSRPPEPGPGELLLAVDGNAGAVRAVARTILARGPAALLGEAAGAERIVLTTAPTLDDLLAATIAKAQLSEADVEDGLDRFADYAALVREGLCPGDVPLDRSLQGVFQALSSLHGSDLADPLHARRFLEEWERLFDAIREAAARGLDPASDDFLSGRPEFARSFAFLKQDRLVYTQDVARGERWLVHIPGGPPRASALVLRSPHSVLFKHWARADGGAPTGDGYLLLGVTWKPRDWIFSTDPVQRLSLIGLYTALQDAEARKAPDRAGEHPWFDGQPFGHTLIGAPDGGSRLDADKVLELVRYWADAEPVVDPLDALATATARERSAATRPWGWIAALVLLLAGVGVGIGWGLPYLRARSAAADRPGGDTHQLAQRGFTRTAPPAPAENLVRSIERTDRALMVGTDHYATWTLLTNPVHDVQTVGKELSENYGFEVDYLLDPLKTELLTRLRDYARLEYGDNDQLLVMIAGHGKFDELFQTGYLVTTESKKEDETNATYLPHSELREILDAIPCNHILLVIDACFGGTFDRRLALGGSGRGEDDPELASRSEFIQRKMKHRTRRYITSGGKEYVPDGRPGMHSPFARRLLEALRSYGGEDAILTLNELYVYLERAEPAPMDGEFETNEPGSSFIFVVRDPPDEAKETTP